MCSRKILLLFLFSAMCSVAVAQNCPQLSEARTAELVEYVRKEYKLKETTDLKLLGNEPLPGTCYRKLTFEGKGPIKVWQITMYLSPDGRFLSGELFDTTIDPIQEQHQQAAAPEKPSGQHVNHMLAPTAIGYNFGYARKC